MPKNSPNNADNAKDIDNSKLVTIAIHTFEKAQILKSMLENAGIPVELTNVNQLIPAISAGVRVKIRETDLARALDVIEETDWGIDEVYQELNYIDRYQEGNPKEQRYVLVPVDFGPYTDKIIKLAFHFASRRGQKVEILHAYFSKFFSVAPMASGDVTFYQSGRELNIRREYEKATKKMQQLKEDVETLIKEGQLPAVEFETTLKDGIPEETILAHARRRPPVIIIMGTRGKSNHNEDLIGSVAAEIIDASRVPVLVVPEEIPVDDLAQIKHIGVATSFDRRDLVLFDRMMSLIAPLKPSLKIFNISRSDEEMGDLELQAITSYHKQHYPESKLSFTRLQSGDFNEALQHFVDEEKIELIVVNTYRRNLFARFFNPAMARRMLFHAGTPLLVMHSRSWR